MKRRTRRTSCGAWLLFLLLAAPVLGGTASPFDEQIGRGKNAAISLPDAKLSGEFGREVAYEIRYTKWSADEPNGKVIVYNHGLQSHRAWFNATAGSLADAGYTVYAFDRIGSGESGPGLSIEKNELEGARGHIRVWELFVETLTRMVELAGDENSGAEIVLWGNSYGAKVVTAYLFSHAETLEAERIIAAVFTTPGLYSNSKTMPLPFSKMKLLRSGSMVRFPVPMVEHDGDNGAAWFVGPGPWFERIRHDELSLRDATRRFWFQTRAMDQYIGGQPKSADFSVPSFHLMVRGDRLMNNEKMEKHLREHAPEGIFKYYSGGPGAKHLLFFTEDAEETISDVRLFLEGRRDRIANFETPEGR